MLLVGTIMQTALSNCIDIFILSFGLVDLPNVHGLSSTVRILSSQFSPPRMQTHDFEVLHDGKVRLRISRAHPWEAWFSLQLFFTLSATTSENFDSCSISVSSHGMTATWSSFTFLVRLGDMSLAIHAACSTTDLGLDHCVTANQA